MKNILKDDVLARKTIIVKYKAFSKQLLWLYLKV